VSVDTRKAMALLAYLVLSRRSVSRDRLAALLWPEADQVRARGALRRTLSALNSALDGHGLRVGRDAVALDPPDLWVDVLQMHELMKLGDAGSLAAALDLYGGDLMEGFALRDSPGFDEWHVAAAEGLRRQIGEAFHRLIGLLDSDVDGAIAHARRWLEIDPSEERAHRALIGLHARKGDRSAAVRQYRECVGVLERELGVPPGAETVEVYEAARRGEGPEPEASETAQLHELMADLLTLQGRYREADRSYRTALELGASPLVVRRKMADLHQRRGDYEEAERLYTAALAELEGEQVQPEDDQAQLARLLADRSLNAHRRGRTEDAGNLAAQALRGAESAGDEPALAQAHNILGMLASHAGNEQVAVEHLEKSLGMAERSGDAVATAAALNNLAHALRHSDVERALKLAERALDLCVRVGDRHREAAMHSNLADLLQAAGREEEARRHLRISAAMFAEVGEPDELRPEIWKLVEW
jgi:DNA-binding SARP family transcriptional activator